MIVSDGSIICYQHKVWHTDSRVIRNPFIAWTYPSRDIVIAEKTLLPFDFQPYRTQTIAVWKIKQLHQTKQSQ